MFLVSSEFRKDCGEWFSEDSIIVILTLKAEGSSKVLYMKNNWMLRCAQHDGNQDCMTFCRHPEPFKGEGSSKVLYMKYNWMLRCAQHDENRDCMTFCRHPDARHPRLCHPDAESGRIQ